MAEETQKDPPWKKIALGPYLANSSVQQVCFQRSAAKALEAFVKESLHRKPVNESGGFLLGHKQEVAPGRWDVYVLAFRPAREAAYSSPNRLDFGPMALIKLDEVLAESEGLELVGWFHTHPGFAVYLSGPDLAIHRGFFRQPWQVAVVMNSLSKDWDTGIFTWTAKGTVNNRTDYPPGKWIRWKVLMENQKHHK